MLKKIVVILALGSSLQANLRLPSTLLSLGNMLRAMPRVLASPHDGFAVNNQREYVPIHTQSLSEAMNVLMSPNMPAAVVQAPHAQQQLALELAGEMAQRAALYNGYIPGLLQQQPFTQFSGVMRQVMRDAGMWEICIEEHLPNGQ